MIDSGCEGQAEESSGAQILTAQNVSAEFQKVFVGWRLALQHKTTLFRVSPQFQQSSRFQTRFAFSVSYSTNSGLLPTPTNTPHYFPFRAEQNLLSQVFRGILVVLAVPAARPVPGIPGDPQHPLGPRLPSVHRSPAAQRPRSVLSVKAGGSIGDFLFPGKMS